MSNTNYSVTITLEDDITSSYEVFANSKNHAIITALHEAEIEDDDNVKSVNVRALQNEINTQFILHIAFDCDPRIEKLNLVPWDSKFSSVSTDEIHIKAPLSLKTRKALYERLSKLSDKPIKTVLYPMTYNDFYGSGHNLFLTTTQRIARYSTMQPPVQTIDCDEMVLAANTQSLYDIIITDKNRNDKHDTPHHQEHISDHIIMVAQEVVKMSVWDEMSSILGMTADSKDVNLLHTAVLYHDLGKYWTKVYDDDKGHHVFNGHENVSAMIFVTDMLMNPDKYSFLDKVALSDKEDSFSKVEDAYIEFENYRQAFTKIVTQVILNHMFAKTDDYTQKVINRRNLTDYEQKLLEVFTIADNRGRIPNS